MEGGYTSFPLSGHLFDFEQQAIHFKNAIQSEENCTEQICYAPILTKQCKKKTGKSLHHLDANPYSCLYLEKFCVRESSHSQIKNPADKSSHVHFSNSQTA